MEPSTRHSIRTMINKTTDDVQDDGEFDLNTMMVALRL